MIGEITWKELSPELQARINSGSGNGGGSSFIIKNIVTNKVVVEVQDQTEFTIPFDDYDPTNCYLDVKINSTWVNPERYTINGLTLTLDEGQDLGTKIFFTIYYLGDENSSEIAEKVKHYLGDLKPNILKTSFEVGTLDGNTGEPVTDSTALRTKDFTEVKPNSSYYIESSLDYHLFVQAYDENKGFLQRLPWFKAPAVLTTPSNCRFIKIITGENETDLSLKLSIYEGKNRLTTVHIGTQEVIDLKGGYDFKVRYIDNDINLPITTIQRQDATAEYSILEIKAPQDNPKEATLTLMRDNLPGGGAEFIDFTDMNYDGERKSCIVVQKRGDGAVLRPFTIGFNGGQGIVDKFEVKPDALKTEVTAEGLKVNNKVVATTDELISLVSRANGDALGYSDGRVLTEDDLKPNYYFKNGRKNGLCVQLFDKAQLGEPLPPGMYHVITTAPWHDFTGGVRQIAIKGGTMYMRTNIDADTWNPWVESATTSQTDQLTLLNGWGESPWGKPHRLKVSRTGNLVNVTGVLKAGTVDMDTIITTLPAEYRPIGVSRSFNVWHFDDPTKQAVVTVYADGGIAIRNGTITQGTKYVVFDMTYDVAKW